MPLAPLEIVVATKLLRASASARDLADIVEPMRVRTADRAKILRLLALHLDRAQVTTFDDLARKARVEGLAAKKTERIVRARRR